MEEPLIESEEQVWRQRIQLEEVGRNMFSFRHLGSIHVQEAAGYRV